MLRLKFTFLLAFILTISQAVSIAEADTSILKEGPQFDYNKETDLYYTSPNTTYSTICGEVLNSTGGVITYRANQALVQHERCVWIVRGGNPSGYNIDVRLMGFSSGGGYSNQLIATCFRLGSTPTHRSLSLTSYNLSPCDILMITFHTGANVAGYQGFLLEYNTQTIGGGNGVSRDSTDMIFQEDFTVLHHPLAAAQYSNNEISTFVLVPANNIYSSTKRTNIAFFLDSIENCCDILTLWVFNGNSASSAKWERREVYDNDLKDSNFGRIILIFIGTQRDFNFG
ncbi:unnamed protein product [Orchesella dallaii]|uniref:CUB domain-containing protein n=1 Tax=Orchesella dallaii TaxID=48710 RepID=A0ABP1RUY5_9HEXA